MTTLELTDEQAAALTAKAVEQGLTLDAWLQKLAEATRHRYTLSELMSQCDPDAPLSVEDQAWLDAPSLGREA